jgi:hypothetical protein
MKSDTCTEWRRWSWGWGCLLAAFAVWAGSLSLLRGAPRSAPALPSFDFEEDLLQLPQAIAQHPAAGEVWEQIRSWVWLPILLSTACLGGLFPLHQHRISQLGNCSPAAGLLDLFIARLPLLFLVRFVAPGAPPDPTLPLWLGGWAIAALMYLTAELAIGELTTARLRGLPVVWSAHWSLLVVACGFALPDDRLVCTLLVSLLAEWLWWSSFQQEGASAPWVRGALLLLAGLPILSLRGSLPELAPFWPRAEGWGPEVLWTVTVILQLAFLARVWPHLPGNASLAASAADNHAARVTGPLNVGTAALLLLLIVAGNYLPAAAEPGQPSLGTTAEQTPEMMEEEAVSTAERLPADWLQPQFGGYFPWIVWLVAAGWGGLAWLGRSSFWQGRQWLQATLAVGLLGVAGGATHPGVQAGMMVGLWCCRRLSKTYSSGERLNGTPDELALAVGLLGLMLGQPESLRGGPVDLPKMGLVMQLVAVGWLARWFPIPGFRWKATGDVSQAILEFVLPLQAAALLLYGIVSQQVHQDAAFGLVIPVFCLPLFVAARQCPAGAGTKVLAGRLALSMLIPAAGILAVAKLELWNRLHPTLAIGPENGAGIGQELLARMLLAAWGGGLLLVIGQMLQRSSGFAGRGLQFLGLLGLVGLPPFWGYSSWLTLLATLVLPHSRSSLTGLFEVVPMSFLLPLLLAVGGAWLGCELLAGFFPEEEVTESDIYVMNSTGEQVPA